MSCFEIYIEKVKDLLDAQNTESSATNLSKWKPVSVEVSSLEHVQILLNKAMKLRSTGSTALNEYSSRSHCMHKLNISVQKDNGEQSSGNLVLIDLAGSERINDSQVSGQSLEESIAINQSLSHLIEVINAIASEKFVPFRNSKLTTLLHKYMATDSKVLMILNICPLQDHYNNSLHSLQFGKKANLCKVEKSKSGQPGFLP